MSKTCDPPFRTPIRQWGLAPALGVVLIASLAASACGTLGLANPFGGSSSGESSVTVEVQNRNFADATIHVLRGSERIRLGIVSATEDRTFTVAWRFSMPMRVNIRLLAGGECITDDLIVDPGDRLFVEVPPDLSSDPDCRSVR